MTFYRRRKYGNHNAAAFQITFRSKAERDHAYWLESEKQIGNITAWIYEKSYDLVVEGKLVCKIIPDFTIINKNNTTSCHEVKGGRITKTPLWALKAKLFKILYPHVDYEVFDGIQKIQNTENKKRSSGFPVIQYD